MRIWRRCKRLSLLEQENEQGLQQNQSVGMEGKRRSSDGRALDGNGAVGEVEDVVQTALRCLSRKDLEAAR